jgi:YihY family inner membrane protein
VNVVERGLRWADRLQQRSKIVAFAIGVIKKYGDDRGGQLAVMLTYYGFLSLFPLLLIMTTVLGFIGNERLADNVIGTTLSQFPVFGEQLGEDAAHPLSGSGVGLAIGLLVLLYGALGFAQAAQHAMAQVWNVPGVKRPGFFPRIARGLLFFSAIGLGMLVGATVSVFVTGHGQGTGIRVLAFVANVLLNVTLYVVSFRVLTPKTVRTKHLLPGAVLAGIGYSMLLALGTALIQRQLRNATALYGQFAFVLGLIAWLYLLAQLTIYAAEMNVVLRRRLWPRSLLQPPLTEADERVLRAIALQEERRPEERVEVAFDPAAEDPP